MANHKSALKRIRSNEAKRLRNTTDKSQGEELLVQVTSMIDKLSKKNIIHKNKAGNLKSQLTKHVASL